MKRWFMFALVLCFGAGISQADTVNYGWEDGGTVLGLFGSGDPPMIVTNVADPDPVHGGLYSLRCEDNSPTGTPQAFIAFVWNLSDGDVVSGGFWRYDTTPGGSPSIRIWGHWDDALPGDPDQYDGSASGNGDYGLGEGWDFHSYDWTVVDGHSGLIIEARTYSNPGDTAWIDDLVVTAPDHAFIQVPGGGPIPNDERTWGGVKALYR